MTRRTRIAGLAGFLLGILGWLAGSTSQAAPPGNGAPLPGGSAAVPRLLVLVVFDQMREDYLERWQDLFGTGGFRRLQKEGAWFQDCHYPYAYTVTGPGHASLATGSSPNRHGIINNEWYDRQTGAVVGCVEAERYAGPGSAGRAVSPEHLKAPALADVLKEAHGERARVVSVSMKDRSAVLPGGHRPDVCCWFDSVSGRFVTSPYYRAGLPTWVERFNARQSADAWAGKTWDRLRPELDYARHSGPDNMPGEPLDRTFPHRLPDGRRPLSKAYYRALVDSPFGNDLLLELARQAVDAEQMGRHTAADLLCVSFSCTDTVGHAFGPDSQEVLDVTLRADRVMQELLDRLDARVGKGRYVLVLTSDHGVCPLPEVSRAAGREAGRVDPAFLASRAESFLVERLGEPGQRQRWLQASVAPWLYLNQALIRARGLREPDVERLLADWARRQPGIQEAYTAGQLAGDLPANDRLGRQVQRCFYPGRSGDVALVVKPYFVFWSSLPGTGTSHGSPHDYDTHVPLLVFGPGVAAGVRKEPITPQAAAAILAHAVGLKMTTDPDATVPAGLFSR